MNDDLAYIRSRIPTYQGYGDEASRRDSDKRVRAIVGEALSDAHVRFAGSHDEKANSAYDDLLMLCMFGDQQMMHRIEHVTFTPEQLADFLAADRALVDLEEQLMNVSTVDEFSGLMHRLHEQFDRRREMVPAH